MPEDIIYSRVEVTVLQGRHQEYVRHPTISAEACVCGNRGAGAMNSKERIDFLTGIDVKK